MRSDRAKRTCSWNATNSLAARDVEALIHPFTNLAEHAVDGPLVIDRGEGVYVYDQDGNRYLEGMAGLWCTALGFSDKRLVEAAVEQLERLPTYHLFGGKSHAPGDRARRAPAAHRAGADGQGHCSSAPAPRPTTPRSSWSATITTRTAAPRSARSSRGCAAITA